MNRSYRCLAFLSVLFCLVGFVPGQTTFSTIRGVVADQTGAVVPGVEVVVTETTTNIPRAVVSDERGSFEIPELRPGTYRLTAALPGFKTFVAENIILESAQTRRIDVALELGETIEEVTVHSGASVITTEGGSITTGFSGESFKDIPLVDTYPGPLSMLATTPGIQGDGWVVSVGGQQSLQVTQEFDGVSNDRTGSQGANVNMYEEVKITAVNNTADKSRIASYNMINRAGSNDFHGGVWYKHVNSAINAREYFDPQKTQFKLHEFQGEASGRIIRDKTFFYVSYFGERFPAGSYYRSTVPTLLMRQGNFSQLLPGLQLVDPLTGEDFEGNVIPTDRLNQMSLRMQDLFVAPPNLGDANTFSNNLGWDFPYPADKFAADMINFRVDHNLTEDNSLYFRYTKNSVPYVLANQLPAFNWTRRRSYSKSVISDTHIFNPGLINTFRFGWNGNYMLDGDTVDGFTPLQGDEAVAAIGLQGVNPGGYGEQGFPYTAISGYSTLQTVDGGIRDDHYDFSWEDSVTWSSGQHVWKFGFQVYKYNDYDARVKTGNYGRFNFNGRFTGNSWADFLLGLPDWSRRLDPLLPREQEAVEVGLYLMDTFKVTPQLTLDYGLRWDYFGSDTIKDGLQYNWDPMSGDVIIPPGTMSSVSPLYPSTITLMEGEVVPKPSKSNFRPRIGLAYRTASDVVVRGGYGVFTERLNYFSRIIATGPFEIEETYTNEINNGQPLFMFPSPWPDLSAAAVPSQSVTGYPLDTKNGLIHQFNLSVEKEIWDIGFRVSYVGSRSRKLNYTLNRNKPMPSDIPFTTDRRPLPQYVSTTYWENDGASNYNSFQIEAKRRVGILNFNGHYTLASNVHNYLNTENPYDVTNHWSYDDFMQRNRAVITFQLDLPVGRGRRYMADSNSVVDAIAGGWKITTISYFANGPHFSPSYSGSDPSNTNTFGGLPDRICDGNLPGGSRGPDGWFDPSCFTVPEEGRFGNSGENVLVAPGLNVHHLSLAKRFNVREPMFLTFTIAASNIFNHPHFNPPRSNISASDPGVITSGIEDWRAEKHASRKFSVKLRLEW